MKKVVVCLFVAVFAFVLPGIVAAHGRTDAGGPSVAARDGAVTSYLDGTIVVEEEDPETSGFGDCPSGWVCLWSEPNYVGAMIALLERGTWINLSSYNFNNTAESWRNRTGDDAKLSRYPTWNSSHPGSPLCLNNNSSDASMGSWNDVVSSVRITNGGGVC